MKNQQQTYLAQYAFITGVSSGLGFDYAREILKKGYNLIAVSRHASKIKEKLTPLFPEQKIITFNYDLTNQENCQIIFDQVQKYHIKLLINNAGYGYSGFFLDQDLVSDINMISLNIVALQILTILFVKHWIKHKITGRVINIGSIAGFGPGPLSATYSATKSYVNMWSLAINAELNRRKSKIKVITIAPGPVATNFMARATSKFSVAKNNPEVDQNPARNKLFHTSEYFCRKSIQKTLRKRPPLLVVIGCRNNFYKLSCKLFPYRIIINRRFKLTKKIYR